MHNGARGHQYQAEDLVSISYPARIRTREKWSTCMVRAPSSKLLGPVPQNEERPIKLQTDYIITSVNEIATYGACESSLVVRIRAEYETTEDSGACSNGLKCMRHFYCVNMEDYEALKHLHHSSIIANSYIIKFNIYTCRSTWRIQCQYKLSYPSCIRLQLDNRTKKDTS